MVAKYQQFVDEGISFKERGKAHSMSNFMVGPRACLGRHLALIEMQVFLSGLVHGYEVEVVKFPTKLLRTALLPGPNAAFHICLVAG